MDSSGFMLFETMLQLILVVALVLLNGFFVAAEFSLVKVRQTRLQQLENEGNVKVKYALKVTSQLDAYLSATQLGITLASLGLGWVGEPAIAHGIVEPILSYFGITDTVVIRTLSFGIAFGLITFLHIVLGELAPKSLAIQKSEETSLWLSAPLAFFYKLMFPAIWFLNGSANKILKMFGIEPASEHDAAHTEEEIRILMNQSVKSGHIDKNEMALFDNIFEFSDRLAREVMLPRIDMDCLYSELTFEENLQIVFNTKHTRYPVAFEDKDQIIGFVHIKDLLSVNTNKETDLNKLIRPIITVPESMEISHVLRLMQKRRSQLALVIDEYGGTAGLITMEDVIEEIVGDIHDEFDNERPEVEINDQVTSVDGRMLVEEVNELFNLTIDDEEVDSIGGWLFTQLEGSPANGKKIEFSNYIFEVAEVDRLRIVRVHIYRNEPNILSEVSTEMN